MPINPDAAAHPPLPPVERSWTSKDTLLYALGVGAGSDDPDGRELPFVTENSRGVAQRVLPTFAVLAGDWNRKALDIGTFDLAQCVHGEQAFTLHRELPPAGTAQVTTRVVAVEDKGSGALLVVEAQAAEATSGAPLLTSRSSVFVRGEGGFGTRRAPSEPPNAPPARDPDAVVTYPTRPEQALLYRLSGDRNPLHSDPVAAREAGFPRPILHGLCTYGVVGRALLHTLCASDPARFVSMEGRFSSPVFPGDSLSVRLWVDGPEAVFTVHADDGRTVVSRGGCTFVA